MTKTQQRNARYKQYVSDASTRLVWRVVTRTPQATTREIGAAIGLGHSGVSAALRMLRDAGYIDFAPRAARARTVLIGYAETNEAAGQGG
jgi:predicted transcriptional regulator